jgi:hypothetical protein
MKTDGERGWLAETGSSEAGGDAAPTEAKGADTAFSESGSATVAALLHLIRLMGAELVLNRGSNIVQFEQAVRKQIGHFSSPTTDPRARDAGLARAQRLVEHVLSQIRAQAELKHSLSAAEAPARKPALRPAQDAAVAYPRKRSGTLN